MKVLIKEGNKIFAEIPIDKSKSFADQIAEAYKQGAREFAEWLLINHILDCIECNHGDRTIGCKECANEYLAEWQKERNNDIK